MGEVWAACNVMDDANREVISTYSPILKLALGHTQQLRAALLPFPHSFCVVKQPRGQG